MRFCMITTFYPPYHFGGDAVFVHSLSNELARRGHEVEVVHCIDSFRALGGADPTPGYQDDGRVTVHGLRSGAGMLSPLATQQTGLPLLKARRIREILDREFDVIHFHNPSLIGGPGIFEYGKGIKLYTLHEYWLLCPTHVLFRFKRAPCTARRCLACTLSYRRPPQLWRYTGLIRRSLRHLDALIAPTRFSEEIHGEVAGHPPIARLPHFVPDRTDSHPRPSVAAVEDTGSPYYLFVGRLEKLKGLQTVIPVFRRFSKARLLIAGTGSYEPELRRLAAGCDNVRFLGRRDSNELEALYRNAIALLVPSICFELFPLVIVEAFRANTPVVVRDIGSLPEIVDESAGGLTYRTDDELMAALDRLVAEREARDRLGFNGNRAYLERWTPDAHLKGYFELIASIGEQT